jgi:phage-related protein
MSVIVFNPSVNPTYDTGGTTKFKVRKIQYGNGYSQRARDGLNSTTQTFKLEWKTIKQSDFDYIYGFFKSLAGTDAFQYQVPGLDNVQRLYVSGEITYKSIAVGVYDLNVDIEECFDLVI